MPTDSLCSECHLRPAPVLFVQELAPVIDFFTRRIIGKSTTITYRRCSTCQAAEEQSSRDYADLVTAGHPRGLRGS